MCPSFSKRVVWAMGCKAEKSTVDHLINHLLGCLLMPTKIDGILNYISGYPRWIALVTLTNPTTLEGCGYPAQSPFPHGKVHTHPNRILVKRQPIDKSRSLHILPFHHQIDGRLAIFMVCFTIPRFKKNIF